MISIGKCKCDINSLQPFHQWENKQKTKIYLYESTSCRQIHFYQKKGNETTATKITKAVMPKCFSKYSNEEKEKFCKKWTPRIVSIKKTPSLFFFLDCSEGPSHNITSLIRGSRDLPNSNIELSMRENLPLNLCYAITVQSTHYDFLGKKEVPAKRITVYPRKIKYRTILAIIYFFLGKKHSNIVTTKLSPVAIMLGEDYENKDKAIEHLFYTCKDARNIRIYIGYNEQEIDIRIGKSPKRG